MKAFGDMESLKACYFLLPHAAIILVASVLLIPACQPAPSITDSSATVVQPGRGISNLCEVGMTISQMRAATHDVTTHGIYDNALSYKRIMSWGHGRFLCIPSLGAIAYTADNQPIALIEFYVRPFRAPLIPGLEVQKPFRGRLGDSLSFKESPVTKPEIVNAFGTISQVAGSPAEATEFRRNAQTFAYSKGNAVEELWYPNKGVAFVLTSNAVTSFQIFTVSGSAH